MLYLLLDVFFQFLTGLNDSYHQLRSQILAMGHLPTIGKVFSLVHQDENQLLLYLVFPPAIDITTVTFVACWGSRINKLVVVSIN